MFNVPPSGRTDNIKTAAEFIPYPKKMSCITGFTAVVIRFFRSTKVVGKGRT
jgi:hypothetical protein